MSDKTSEAAKRLGLSLPWREGYQDMPGLSPILQISEGWYRHVGDTVYDEDGDMVPNSFISRNPVEKSDGEMISGTPISADNIESADYERAVSEEFSGQYEMVYSAELVFLETYLDCLDEEDSEEESLHQAYLCAQEVIEMHGTTKGKVL